MTATRTGSSRVSLDLDRFGMPKQRNWVSALPVDYCLPVSLRDRPAGKIIAESAVQRHQALAKPLSMRSDACVVFVDQRRNIDEVPSQFRNQSEPRWTVENRQFVDRSKPAISGAAETSEFYFVPSSVRKSVCTLVRQLRGPHFSTCA